MFDPDSFDDRSFSSLSWAGLVLSVIRREVVRLRSAIARIVTMLSEI